MSFEGLDFSMDRIYKLISAGRGLWSIKILSYKELFMKLYNRQPKELIFVRELILLSLLRVLEHWENVNNNNSSFYEE